MPTPAVPTSTIRTWARAEGFDVAERGRLKPEILDAYDAAQRGTKAKAAPPKPVPAAKSKAPASVRKPARAPSAVAPTPAAEAVPDAAAVVQDHRLADLESAVAALTARVAKLEAAPAAPQKNKWFSRRA